MALLLALRASSHHLLTGFATAFRETAGCSNEAISVWCSGIGCGFCNGRTCENPLAECAKLRLQRSLPQFACCFPKPGQGANVVQPLKADDGEASPTEQQEEQEQGEGEGYDYQEDGAWSGPDGRHEEL